MELRDLRMGAVDGDRARLAHCTPTILYSGIRIDEGIFVARLRHATKLSVS